MPNSSATAHSGIELIESLPFAEQAAQLVHTLLLDRMQVTQSSQVSAAGFVAPVFALNRRYPVNDKTVLEEIGELERAPRAFGPRVQETLSRAGTTPAELAAAVSSLTRLLEETAALSEGLYQPRYRFDR